MRNNAPDRSDDVPARKRYFIFRKERDHHRNPDVYDFSESTFVSHHGIYFQVRKQKTVVCMSRITCNKLVHQNGTQKIVQKYLNIVSNNNNCTFKWRVTHVQLIFDRKYDFLCKENVIRVGMLCYPNNIIGSKINYTARTVEDNKKYRC